MFCEFQIDAFEKYETRKPSQIMINQQKLDFNYFVYRN